MGSSRIVVVFEVSIRASLQQRGERVACLVCFCFGGVSIRASLQQRGEPRSGNLSGAEDRFQSAPHFSSEANQSRLSAQAGRFLVSIRASLQQRGERHI